MKKLLFFFIISWLIFLFVLYNVYKFESEYNSDNKYRLEINRIHNFIEEEFEKNALYSNFNITLIENKVLEAFTDFKEIKNVKILESSWNSNSILEKESNLECNSVILFLKNKPYFVKYEIVKRDLLIKKIIMLLTIFFILSNILLFICIYIIKTNILNPLKEISDYPEKLAKGKFVENQDQKNKGYLNDFFWSLDMLQNTLNEERKKNLSLIRDKQTLIASLSHEIKNPLSIIKNYTLALLDDIYNDKNEKIKALNIILKKTDKIEEISKKLLNSSQNEISNFEIEITEIYSYYLFDILKNIVKESIEGIPINFSISKPNKNMLVLADEKHLIEVFSNLIENAIKYGDNNNLFIDGQYEEGFLIINFFNSGEAIPKNEIKHIFSSFYRGSNIGKKSGNGLGLYISKKIMKAINGDIFATNKNNGVNFTLIIEVAK